MTVPDLHPPLSSLPFAFILGCVLAEIACAARPSEMLRSAATFNVLLAAVSAILAFFTGYQASETANQTFVVPDAAISIHHAFGRALLFVVIPCAALRITALHATHGKRAFASLYYVALTASLALAIYTGYLGGKLVFEEGAGVRAKPGAVRTALEN